MELTPLNIDLELTEETNISEEDKTEESKDSEGDATASTTTSVITTTVVATHKWERLLHKKRDGYRELVCLRMLEKETPTPTVVSPNRRAAESTTSTISTTTAPPNPTKPPEFTSAMEGWTKMELEAENADIEYQTKDGNGDESEEADQRLSDFVMRWIAKVFQPLFTLPYSTTLINLVKTRAHAQVRNLIKSEKEHNLANKVEEVVKDEEKEIIRMDKKTFRKKLRKPLKKKRKKRCKKNLRGRRPSTLAATLEMAPLAQIQKTNCKR